MRLALFATVFALSACAGRLSSHFGGETYGVHVDAPRAGSLVRDPEIDVRGTISTYDHRGWVWVDGVEAHMEENRFIAKHVPLAEGATQLTVSLTDGKGKRFLERIPLIVENPDRPREQTLCGENGSCIAYEVRGRPRREADGKIENAVFVLTPLGFSEALDNLWPDLIGPERALDTRAHYVVGVSPARSHDRVLATADENIELLERLLSTGSFSRPATVVGVATLGTELALRWLRSHPQSIGRLIGFGGHDRPASEPTFQAISTYLTRNRPPERGASEQASTNWWRGLVDKMFADTFTESYLNDRASAAEWALEHETKADGLPNAMRNAMVRHFLAIDPRDLEIRVADAQRWKQNDYQIAPGTRVWLIANRLDRTTHLTKVEETAKELTTKGAQVEVKAFDDARGHSVFFRSSEVIGSYLRQILTP